MRLKLYQEVAVTRDMPDENLKAGDVAVLVDYVPDPRGTKRRRSWKSSMPSGKRSAWQPSLRRPSRPSAPIRCRLCG